MSQQGNKFLFDSTGALVTTSSGGGGTSNVNITEINGSAPALSNPLPVELSDGTNALGVSGNPLYTASEGATGATAPTKASEEGLIARTSLPTAVTNGQLVGALGDKFGRQIMTLNGMRDIIGTASVQNTGSSGTLIAAITSTYCDIITLIFTNESGTATVVSVSDGTTTYKYAIAANGGIVVNFPTPLPATSAATNWTVSNSASSTVDCVAVYVKNQ